jgi:hypothetical protein
LGEAGFDALSREYVFIRRQRPCDAALERYVELYLQNLLETIGERLSESARVRLTALADRDSDRFLPRQENFFFGSLQVLMTARAGPAR